jgi:hypothetical protein
LQWPRLLIEESHTQLRVLYLEVCPAKWKRIAAFDQLGFLVGVSLAYLQLKLGQQIQNLVRRVLGLLNHHQDGLIVLSFLNFEETVLVLGIAAAHHY